MVDYDMSSVVTTETVWWVLHGLCGGHDIGDVVAIT